MGNVIWSVFYCLFAVQTRASIFWLGFAKGSPIKRIIAEYPRKLFLIVYILFTRKVSWLIHERWNRKTFCNLGSLSSICFSFYLKPLNFSSPWSLCRSFGARAVVFSWRSEDSKIRGSLALVSNFWWLFIKIRVYESPGLPNIKQNTTWLSP